MGFGSFIGGAFRTTVTTGVSSFSFGAGSILTGLAGARGLAPLGGMGTAITAGAVHTLVKGGTGVVQGSGVLRPFKHQKQGMGIVGMGPGYNTTFKKQGQAMPHNNLGATGDLALAMHSARHGVGR